MPPADRVSESFILTTFMVPEEGNRSTKTFLYVRPVDRLQVGLAYIWANESLRLIGSYNLLSPTQRAPGASAGFVFQDAFENKVSPYLALIKRAGEQSLRAEGYLGATRRPNEDHLHLIGGLKISLGHGFYGGVQYTGHDMLAFVGISLREASLALWIREDRRPGVSLSVFRHRH